MDLRDNLRKLRSGRLYATAGPAVHAQNFDSVAFFATVYQTKIDEAITNNRTLEGQELDDDDDATSSLPILDASSRVSFHAGKEANPLLESASTLLPSSAPPRAQSLSNKRRAKKRANTPSAPVADKIKTALLAAAAPPLVADMNADALPSAEGAYQGINIKHSAPKKEWSLPNLLEAYPRMQHIKWDGKTPRGIVDAKDVAWGMLAGQPDKPNYQAAVKLAAQMLDEATAKTAFARKWSHHRRGPQASIHTGISMGMGLDKPTKSFGGEHSELIRQLMDHSAFKLISSYTDWSFKLWAPRLYRHYMSNLSELYQLRPSLLNQLNFGRLGPFPSCTFNFGGAVCFKHTDPLNVPYGWCGVTALGDFDHTTGGQIILWDAWLVIDFPAGSQIFLPSAVMTHSNTTIAPHEKRFSFTQYCAGGIFRWVDAGGEIDGTIKKRDYQEYLRMMEERKGRWEECLKLLPRGSELRGVDGGEFM